MPPHSRAARQRLAALAPALTLACAACPAPEGLRATPAGDGPRIVVDWDAEPLPEIPFPNDLAARPDATSPTGLRLNLSLEAPTELEREARRKVNEMTGFGLFSPITVRFDAPLDLDNLATRHAWDGNRSDDAVFLVDVTPRSPTYLRAMDLDLGHGRFPGDLVQADRYFPNDPRSESPSLLFETYEEDLDGDGELDPGEDSDGDGVLDHPNVYPEGGDPREDLLTWYERETDTLIVRPVKPLRERTTYAVVLTERIVGADGNPVRSPWDWVNHTRQTEALAPLSDALPWNGVELDELAFAWVFTTGSVTSDLVDVRRGLHGEGPFAWLEADYPAAVEGAMPLHVPADDDPAPNPYRLSADRLISVIASVGLFPPESEETLTAAYAWSDAVVAAHFTTPDLMADRDDGGGDSSDEWWQIDAYSGTLHAEPLPVAFTCALPKPDAEHQPPFPVAVYGHGYGSSRIEAFGFAWALNRVGIALCSMDFPGHGLELSGGDADQIEPILEAAGLLPFLEHLQDDRDRDLDNDGVDDSGADQWIADGFHTRDMVRQAVVDWSQWLRALQNCGQGSLGTDVDGDGDDEVSCDWDGDGRPDIGGPDVDYFLLGGSLGGINSAVAAAVEPLFSAVVPAVPGAGLMDVGWRSNLGGVAEAVPGRVLSPMFMGFPNGDGTIRLSQYVTSEVDMVDLTVAAALPSPPGGSVRVENLSNGESQEGPVDAEGRFRVGIAADAADPWEKRVITGMEAWGPLAGQTYEVAGNEGLGDLLRVTIRDAAGAEVAVVETWEQDVLHEGVTMRAGSPLIAAGYGLGHRRGTPRLRRVVNVLSMVTEGGDPVAYAPHYVDEPFAELGGRVQNVLVVPSPGDPIVPVATGINLSRAANLYDGERPRARYGGLSVDQWLVERQVIRGLEEFGPWTDPAGNPVLFDPDDLDEGTDGFGAPSDAPLRIERPTVSGVSGMRLTYSDPHGAHSFGLPDPTRPFDIATYSVNMMARYIQTRGQEIADLPCLEDSSCAFFRDLPAEGEGR